MKKLIFLACVIFGHTSLVAQSLTTTTDKPSDNYWNNPNSPIVIVKDRPGSAQNLVQKTNSAKAPIAITFDNFSPSLQTFVHGGKPKDKFNVWDKLKAIRSAVKSERQSAIEGKRSGALTPAQFDATNQAITTDKRKLQAQLYDNWIAGVHVRFIPARSAAMAQCFYGNDPDQVISALKNNSVSFNDSSAGVYTEFFNGFMGPIRYSLGGFFSRTKAASIDSSAYKNVTSAAQLQDTLTALNKQVANIQSLITGGGNLMLINSLPLLDMSDVNKLVKCTLYGNNKATVNIPGMSTGITKVSFMDELSTELFFNWNISNFSTTAAYQNNLSVFLHAKAAMTICTEQFVQDAGLGSGQVIGIVTFDGGVTIAQNVRLLFKYVLTTKNTVNNGITKWSVGINVTPSKL
jgi:hypothetical protein